MSQNFFTLTPPSPSYSLLHYSGATGDWVDKEGGLNMGLVVAGQVGDLGGAVEGATFRGAGEGATFGGAWEGATFGGAGEGATVGGPGEGATFGGAGERATF